MHHVEESGQLLGKPKSLASRDIAQPIPEESSPSARNAEDFLPQDPEESSVVDLSKASDEP